MQVDRWSPEEAALVIVDAQNDFCHPEGSAARAGFDVRAVAPAAERLCGLIDGARAAGVPVVFVRTTHDDEVDSVEWQHRLRDGIGGGLEPTPPNCVTGTWGAEFYEVRPASGEPVVTKHRYSAFAGTDLGEVLAGIGRRSLLFAGFTTNVCVETSLRDGLCRDHLVAIVEDCCAAFDPVEHEMSIAGIDRYFGRVVTSQQLDEHWRRASEEPAG